MSGSVVEHPDRNSDPELAASTNQQINLAGIEQLCGGVDANVLWTSGLDDEDLTGGYVLHRTDEVGERYCDRGKFEGCGGVCPENGTEEGR